MPFHPLRIFGCNVLEDIAFFMYGVAVFIGPGTPQGHVFAANPAQMGVSSRGCYGWPPVLGGLSLSVVGSLLQNQVLEAQEAQPDHVLRMKSALG